MKKEPSNDILHSLVDTLTWKMWSQKWNEQLIDHLDDGNPILYILAEKFI